MPDDREPAARSMPAGHGQPEVVGVLRMNLSSIALGPDYPPAAISAEIGRVAIAAARVDQEYALLLHALHGGKRAQWDLENLRKLPSGDLRKRLLRLWGSKNRRSLVSRHDRVFERHTPTARTGY